MRVLVTGASGFVGRHLVPHLLQAGHGVRGTGRSRERPGHLHAAAEWAGGVDLLDGDLRPLLADINAVVHLAARAHRTSSTERSDSSAFHEANVVATERLAGAVAQGSAVRRFVFLSSIGAICDAASQPVNEQTVPHPRSPYGRSKLEAERVLQRTLDPARTTWVILRPPLVYGPGNPGNMARLLRFTRRGLPLPLGGLQNRRSLIFVGNLVDAIRVALDQPHLADRVFHVADLTAVSTPALLRGIAAARGSRARLIRIPDAALTALGRLGDLATGVLGSSIGIDSYSVDRLRSSLVVDSALFRNAARWTPPFDLLEGLQRTFAPAAQEQPWS